MTEENGTPAVVPRRGAARTTAALVGLALVAGAAVLYGVANPGKDASPACLGGEAAAAKLKPLARGEVAALAIREHPVLAPDLTFQAGDGGTVTLARFRGRTVLVNFWATWCVPCRQEMPALDRLQSALGGPDFEVVAINVDTAKLDRPRAFLKEHAIGALAFYADPTAGVLQAMKGGEGLLGLPTTLVVDRQGCALGVMAGPADWSSPDATALIAAAKS